MSESNRTRREPRIRGAAIEKNPQEPGRESRLTRKRTMKDYFLIKKN